MSIDDRDLEMTPRRSAVAHDDDDGGKGSPIAGIIGGVILLAILGGGAFGIYKFFSNLPELPGEQKAKIFARKPARDTEFVIKNGNYPPAADNSRYGGAVEAYVLRGVDRARQLAGEIATNYNAKLDDMANDIEGGPNRAKNKKGGPPGPGCTVAEVRDYYERKQLDFLDLPPDLVWAYDAEKGTIYMAMK